jgi:hypothetical protein
MRTGSNQVHRLAAMGLVAALATGCGGDDDGPEVKTNVQTLAGTDFCRYETFDFYDWNEIPGSLPTEPGLVGQAEIISQNEITSELNALGLRQEDTLPDLQINRMYFVGESTELIEQCIGIGSGGGYGFWFGYSCGWLVPVDYTIGTMVVDLVDRADDELVFRGVAERTVEQGNEGQKLEAVIDQAMKEIFNVYEQQVASCPAR